MASQNAQALAEELERLEKIKDACCAALDQLREAALAATPRDRFAPGVYRSMLEIGGVLDDILAMNGDPQEHAGASQR